jgi:hypothetical protein
MPEMVKSSETKIIADDSLLFRTINNQADSLLLQNDLASLQDWEDKWQMSFIFFRFVGFHTELVYSIVGLTMDVYAADFTGLVQSFF